MNYPFCLISVFTKEPDLIGNISAVVELTDSLSKEEMQRIARDLNQPATTFIRRKENDTTWQVHWFAPDAEIPLCGHGSAAAIVYLSRSIKEEIRLVSDNGILSGVAESDHFSLTLPVGKIFDSTEPPKEISQALGVHALDYCTTSDKDIVLVKNEEELKNMRPNFAQLKQLKPFGYAVTAKGDTVDFVSRTLVPKVKQLEDHATGSSHTVLLPYWQERLKKSQFETKQLSPRGGFFTCFINSTSVILKGHFKFIAKGELF